jgi:hypothetical protein
VSEVVLETNEEEQTPTGSHSEDCHMLDVNEPRIGVPGEVELKELEQ